MDECNSILFCLTSPQTNENLLKIIKLIICFSGTPLSPSTPPHEMFIAFPVFSLKIVHTLSVVTVAAILFVFD